MNIKVSLSEQRLFGQTNATFYRIIDGTVKGVIVATATIFIFLFYFYMFLYVFILGTTIL